MVRKNQREILCARLKNKAKKHGKYPIEHMIRIRQSIYFISTKAVVVGTIDKQAKKLFILSIYAWQIACTNLHIGKCIIIENMGSIIYVFIMFGCMKNS